MFMLGMIAVEWLRCDVCVVSIWVASAMSVSWWLCLVCCASWLRFVACSMMVLRRCCVRIAVNVWLCLVGVVCLGCVVWLCRVLAATCSVVTFENLLTSVGRRRLQRRRRLRRRRRRKYFPLVGCVKCCVSLATFCVFRAKSTPYNVRDLLCT